MSATAADERGFPQLRLLLIPADRYPPERVDVRILFADEIAGMGHAVDWIMQSAAPCASMRVEPYAGGRAWIGPARSGSSSLARAVRFIQGLLHEFRVFSIAARGRYHFIQSKDEFVGALLALFAARLNGARFAYWLSYPFPEAWLYAARSGMARYPVINRIRGRLFGFLLYRVILPAADVVFVQSAQMKDDIAARGVSVSKMYPVPMGVAEDIFSQGDADTVQEQRPTLIYLGTMARPRRIDFVLEVFARVVETVPEAQLMMVGGEPGEIGFLRTRAVALGVAERVTFTGKLSHAQALASVRRAHVCLSPFYPTPILNSTSPTKLVEYMALGRPVVANHHPEQSRVIAESGAGLCVPYDPDAFARAASCLLMDPERARKMGSRGREYAKKRAYPVIARDVIEHYRSAMAGS